MHFYCSVFCSNFVEMKRGEIFKWIIAVGALIVPPVLLFSCGGISSNDPFDTIRTEDIDIEEYLSVETSPSPSAAAAPEIKQGERHNDRIRVNNIGPLRQVFNDSNKYHYAVAEKIGISPISGVEDAYFTRRPLVKINSCQWYEVDSLTHSMPFLVPEAARLLEKIGRNFIDSLASRGADGYRIKVTSVLRTPHTVKRLRRVNRNATDSSTHQFATTFDLSYSKFHCLDSSRTIHDGDLKNLLAEVLRDLREQGKCLVKFERHSPCFHITATGK